MLEEKFRKSVPKAFLLILIILVVPIYDAIGWGFSAHQRINSDAVDMLPEGLKPFFVANRDYIAEHAPDPDRWKRDDDAEGPRH